MKITLPLTYDSDNNYPDEVTIERRTDGDLRFDLGSRRFDINAADLAKALKALEAE